MNFESLGLDHRILSSVKHLGFKTPTPVQVEAIPPAVAGRDVMASAETGSGKTAAFLLPVAHRLLHSERSGYPRALIIVPTRELAVQSIEPIEKMQRGLHLRAVAVYGGVSAGPQKRAIAQGIDIIAATPGRLLDYVRSGAVNLDQVGILVLDEVDRMLDMGFLPDVRKIIRGLPAERQNLVFSATIPKAVRDLADPMLKDPARVRIGDPNASPAALQHTVYPTEHEHKLELIVKLLENPDVSKALVFVPSKRDVEDLYRALGRAGIAATRLHSDRSQKQRLDALEHFEKKRVNVLVATELASRGLDVTGITHVINADVPLTPEQYLHRTGRTARAKAGGHAWTLVSPGEEKRLNAIERELRITVTRVVIAGLGRQRREARGPFSRAARRDPFVKSDFKKRAPARRYPWQH